MRRRRIRPACTGRVHPIARRAGFGYDPRASTYARRPPLAHSKSAKKRWRQSLQRRDRNRSVKSQTRTLLGKALAAIQDDASTAEEPLRRAVSALDKAAQKGIIHENAAARGKSRLLKRYNLAIASSVATAAAATPSEQQTEEKPRARRGRSAASGTGTSRRRTSTQSNASDDNKPARGRTRKT